MHFVTARIKNFAAFQDSGEMRFERGINVIVGKNNAGKSALLEALMLDAEHKPHRTANVVSLPGSAVNPQYTIEATVEVAGSEVEYVLLQPHEFFIVRKLPLPWGFNDAVAFLDDLYKRDQIQLSFKCVNKGIVAGDTFPAHNLYEAALEGSSTEASFIRIRVDEAKKMMDLESIVTSISADFPYRVISTLKNNMFRFGAERFAIHLSGAGPDTKLAHDASNLPTVLGNLTPGQQARFNQAIHRLIPSIKQLWTRQATNGKHELLVWRADPGDLALERRDLAIPINQCGTGVAQLAAMLYVVLTSEHATTFLIDEPQSFLHPSATRVLLDIFCEYPQHQYIIATHSADIVSHPGVSTITLVQNENLVSQCTQVSEKDMRRTARVFSDIGLRVQDYFGYGRILWVEGQTEEACFELILSMNNCHLGDTIIRAVVNTGDFDGKLRKRALELYRRVCSGYFLLPQAVSIVLDRENRDDEDIELLRKEFGDLLYFLEKPTFEDYINHEAAVQYVFESEVSKLTLPDVEQDSSSLGSKFAEIWRQEKDRNQSTPKHFASVFRLASDHILEYDKVRHGRMVTERILQIEPSWFAGLVSELAPLLERS